MPDSLVGRVRGAVAAAQAAVRESEDRKEYREARGRQLSEAHRLALAQLQGALRGLGDRLEAILKPEPDVETLRAEFEGLRARLRLEE